MVRLPAHGAVGGRFAEERDAAGRRLRHHHHVVVFAVANLPRQLDVAVVAAGNAAQAARLRAAVAEVEGRHAEAVQRLEGRLRVELPWFGAGEGFRGAVVRVQTAARHPGAHPHAEDAVEAEAVAQLRAHHRHRRRVVHQVDEGLAPVEKARTRAVGAAGHAEAVGAVGAARIVLAPFLPILRHFRQALVENGVQRRHLRGVEHVLDDEVALQVVEVVSQFGRFVHASLLSPSGSGGYSPNTHNTPPWGTCSSVRPRMRKESCWRSASTPQPASTATYCLPSTA